MRLSPTTTICEDDSAELQAVREAFARDHAVVLPGFLTEDFAELVRRTLAKAAFVPESGNPVGSRAVEQPGHAGAALRLVLQRPDVLRWMERVTGRGPLDRATGVVSQLRASDAHQLRWHNDLIEDRRLAITVNLSDHSYEGGAFEMRDRSSGRVVFRHVHDEPTSALVFDLGKEWQHRVLAITSGGPRTVFSGWFLGPRA